MEPNPLLKLQTFGQSIWMDFIQRKIIRSGKLKKLIEEDGLRGVTSNPTIFEKAIGETDDYDEAIAGLARQGKETREIYESLAIADIQAAADLFRPTYDRLEGRDGFVSLEVNPHLAHDTAGTVAEARRLWASVDRPNIFIKVPATLEGLPAIRQLISEGINVNVTLLFGLPRYREVTGAYISGLKDRLAAGKEIGSVASVASFFLSRIDVLVDPLLERRMKEGSGQAAAAKNLRGKVAVASAKIAYQMYREIFQDGSFRDLAGRGAQPQRVLWASTSTKNPEYSDVKYVEPLIGPETVNTLPLKTIDAYRDHGNPAPRLEEDVEESRKDLAKLADLGMDIDRLTQQLEDEGVEKFNRPYDKLMRSIEKKRTETKGSSRKG
ncbi:MAG: transaldolase [Planctomycetaceae bacterium]